MRMYDFDIPYVDDSLFKILNTLSSKKSENIIEMVLNENGEYVEKNLQSEAKIKNLEVQDE